MGGLNLFAYVDDDPTNDTDPEGLVSGNDLTYLYQKLGQSGEHLKYGITVDPVTRYTAQELAGGKLIILNKGPRDEMLKLERNLHKTMPLGPEERQACYQRIQQRGGISGASKTLGVTTFIANLLGMYLDYREIEQEYKDCEKPEFEKVLEFMYRQIGIDITQRPDDSL